MNLIKFCEQLISKVLSRLGRNSSLILNIFSSLWDSPNFQFINFSSKFIMDFTQRHKINSEVPKPFQNRPQTVMPNAISSNQQRMQTFPSQIRANHQNINHPYLHSMPVNQQIQSKRPYQIQPLNQVFMNPQYSEGDFNRNNSSNSSSQREINMQTYIPDSGICCPSNSFQHHLQNIQFSDQNSGQNEDVEEFTVDAAEELDSKAIEFFQCSPSPSILDKQPNHYNRILDSMKKFSLQPNPVTNRSKHSDVNRVNHHTFSCKHEDEENLQDEISDAIQQKQYRSHTRIISIPNGVKIITEILKDDNETTDGDEFSLSRKKESEKWINKEIEISVDEVEEDESWKDAEK